MKTINIKKILVPIDFSELSTYAVEYAMQIAHLHTSKIILVHAIEDMLNFSVPGDFVLNTEEFIEKEKAIHQVKSERIKQYAEAMRVKYSYEFEYRVIFGKSHRAITELVEEEKIDLLVMSTHGVSGFREFVIGSNAVRIISECPCPVLSVQKQMPKYTIKRILLPFKDDPFSRQKVNIAIQFAKWFDAEIYTLGIETEGEESHYIKIQREGNQIKQYLDEFGVKNNLKIVESNNVSKAILDYGKEIDACMLLVMADMEREDFVEYIMGPVAQQLVNHSKIPVLSIQPTRHPDTIDLHPYGW
jgi:nucleotide-binding universal stress UspA family protein